MASDMLITSVLGNFDRGHYVGEPWGPKAYADPYTTPGWFAGNMERNTFKPCRKLSLRVSPELVEGLVEEIRERVQVNDLAILILTYYATDTSTSYRICFQLNQQNSKQFYRFIMDDLHREKEKLTAARALIPVADQIARRNLQSRLVQVEAFFTKYPGDFTLEQVEELMFDEVWAIANDKQKIDLIALAATVNPKVMEMGCLEIGIYKTKQFIASALQYRIVQCGIFAASAVGIIYFAVVNFDAFVITLITTIVLGILSVIIHKYEIEGWTGWLAQRMIYVCAFAISITFMFLEPKIGKLAYNMLKEAGPALQGNVDAETAMKISICGPKVKAVWQELIQQERSKEVKNGSASN